MTVALSIRQARGTLTITSCRYTLLERIRRQRSLWDRKCAMSFQTFDTAVLPSLAQTRKRSTFGNATSDVHQSI